VVIPGNDDAQRAIQLYVSAVADACIEGRARNASKVSASEFVEVTEAVLETTSEEGPKDEKSASAESTDVEMKDPEVTLLEQPAEELKVSVEVPLDSTSGEDSAAPESVAKKNDVSEDTSEVVAKKAPAKKAPAKKAPAKKVAVKKPPVKKAATKKSPVKKAEKEETKQAESPSDAETKE
ncbi:MAG: hypothetical protein P8K11_04785, partial [Gammaproteobacteria bacterium]|nr:hypothetical protein [Gammaproteobacteria bacterium]